MSPKLQRIVSDILPVTIIAVVLMAPWIVLKHIEERRVRRSVERNSK